MFMHELLGTLRRAAIELTIARGRLRTRGHTMARAQIAEAHGHVARSASGVAALVDQVWGEAATLDGLDEALDVQWTQQVLWALQIAGEAVDTARTALRCSSRQWVARAHLSDAQGRIKRAQCGLTEMSRRAWG